MRSPRSGSSGLAKVPFSRARSAGTPPGPPSKMYLVELRPSAKLVMPSRTLIPSRKQVLPEPLGPVATLIPSVSSGTGSGRKQPQWTNCTSSSRGIGVPIAGCSCRRDPRSMWGELAPPTAPQRRLCHGGGGWVFLCCLRSEFGGAVAQVGEPLVAGQQLSDLVGGLLVVEGLQQRPGEQLPLAQAQVAGLAQQHQHVAEVAAAEPPAEHDPQLVGAEVDHGRVVLQPRQRTAERGHPAVGPERVGELAAGLGQTAANLVANLFVGQLGYLGSGHRAGQEDPAELDGVQEAGSSRAGGSAAAGCSGAAVWGTATGTSSMRCSGPMGSGGSSEGSWTTRPRTPVWLATPTSSCPKGSIRGRGSREAIRLPSPIGPQRDHASTAAAMRVTACAQVPPTTHLLSVAPSMLASQRSASPATTTKSGTTSIGSTSRWRGCGSGASSGSG